MQNYRAGPVGLVGRRGVPRGIGERTLEGREVERETRQEGPAAPQPTSTSGLVKVSVAGPSVLLFFLLLRHLVVGFFSSCSRRYTRCPILSVSLFLACYPCPRHLSPPLRPPSPLDGVRTALSRHTVLGPTPSPVPSQVLLFFFFLSCNLRSCEIPISGDSRVIERRRIA